MASKAEQLTLSLAGLIEEARTLEITGSLVAPTFRWGWKSGTRGTPRVLPAGRFSRNHFA